MGVIMSTALKNLMVSGPPLFTQTRDFRIFMEPFIPILRNFEESEKLELTPELKHLHDFSLESLLLDKGLSLEDIHIIQRVNGIECSHRLDNSKEFLIIPSADRLSTLKAVYKNKMKK